jgi:uncharacterized MAPEG superfamily protein
MTVSLYCLVGWCVWALVLVTAIAITRTAQVLLGKKRSNEFPSGMQHGGDAYWRLNRAHVNAVENLPIFAALILVAHLAHADVQTLAEVALGARLVQSVVHISSNAVMAVNVRFTAFVTQACCFGVMAGKLLMR